MGAIVGASMDEMLLRGRRLYLCTFLAQPEWFVSLPDCHYTASTTRSASVEPKCGRVLASTAGLPAAQQRLRGGAVLKTMQQPFYELKQAMNQYCINFCFCKLKPVLEGPAGFIV